MSVPIINGGNRDIVRYDDSISLNGNVNFSLSGSSYSDETEITSYIGNIFSSIDETLSGFNSLVQCANRYLDRNKDISNIPVPEFTSLDFLVDVSGLYDNIGTNAVVKTKGSNLNIRSGPGTSNNVIGEIPNGEDLRVLESDGDWAKISYTDKNGNEVQGYVSSKYIKENNDSVKSTPNNKEPEVLVQTATTDANASSQGQNNVQGSNYQVKTKGSNLNVRSGPSTKYGVLESLPTGTNVKVLGTEGNWYKIQIGDDPNKTGYVYKEYIEKQ